MLNYLLYDCVFNVEELVGGSARSGRRRNNRWLDDTVDRLKPRFIPVGTRTNISRKFRETLVCITVLMGLDTVYPI